MTLRTSAIVTLSTALFLSGIVATAAPPSSTPDTAALAGALANQQIEWGPCTFSNAAEAAQLQNTMECATVTVPRDWHNAANGQTFQIAISRSGNTDTTSENHVGTLFINPGGPGEPGVRMSGVLNARAPELAATHTLIGFDPRGVGQSSTVECTFTYDASQPYAIEKAMAETCGSNPDMRLINTEQTAYDMDFIRHLLGVEKLSYLGYSYGTWLGAWYGSVFGANTEAMILDSATNVTASSLEATFQPLQAKARNRLFYEHLMNWIARHDDQFGLGEDPLAIYRAYLKGQAALDPQVLRALFTLTKSNISLYRNEQFVNIATFVKIVVAAGQLATVPTPSGNPAADALGLLNSVESSPVVEDAISQAEVLAKLEPATGTQTATTKNVFFPILCQDGQWDQDLAAVEQRVARYQEQFPFVAALGQVSVTPCTFWTTDLSMPRPTEDFPKTIVLHSELDSATGWDGGLRTGLHLPNTSFIAIDNEGSHALFPYRQENVDRPILDFLNKGVMPADITVVQAKPLPGDTSVYESWLPLNDKAEYYGENLNDPWQPVPGAKGAESVADSSASLEVAESQQQRIMNEFVLEIYGTEGIEVLANES